MAHRGCVSTGIGSIRTHQLPRKTTVAVGKLEVREVVGLHGLRIRGLIDAVSPSRLANMRAVDLRTEMHHALVHHTTLQGIAAYNFC